MGVNLCLLVTLSLVFTVSCSKILCVYHTPAYSHLQLGDAIAEALASRGHEVTVITPYPPKEKKENMTHIVLSEAEEKLSGTKSNLFFLTQVVPKIFQVIIREVVGFGLTENLLNDTEVQSLLKSSKEFDLVIMEPLLNDALTGFCYHYKAHCVLLNNLGVTRIANERMGNSAPPSYLTEMQLEVSHVKFWDRFYNAVLHVAGNLAHHLYGLRKQNQLLQQYFPGAPHLYDLYYNASLMLMSSHISISLAYPLLPNMIEIGGFWLKPAKNLSNEWQKYMDQSEHGVIILSFGSNLKSADLPHEKRDAILSSFAKLKYDIVWKWEHDELPNKPNNVKIAKWLPLSDLLAHPKMKLFITHGGLLSTAESVYHSVPFVGIPVFADQGINMNTAETYEYGIKVPYRGLTEESLSAAVNEILSNPKYLENVRKRSKILHDEPIGKIDKAMFWIEYVIRHNGAPHLRTAAINLHWYQYLLLDVIALIVVCVSILVMIIYKLISILIRIVKKNGSSKSKYKQKYQ